MENKAKHRHNYRILIIPDDKDEPRAFSLTLKQLGYLKIIAVILGLHMLGGLIFYVQYYRLHQKNATLTLVHQQLEDNNSRINKLMTDFQDLEIHQEKIRKALGLGGLNGDRTTTELIIPPETASLAYQPDYEDSRSQRRQDSGQQQMREKHNFLKSSTNPLHDFHTSVPTLLPVDGIMSADYENILYSDPAQHRGIDIAADLGKPVRASADGVVIFSGWTYDLGNLMIIYHGDGFYTYYGHNEQLLLKRGSMVKKGEVIGLLGNSGVSSAPHLHFEIWKDGIALDPKEYILEFSQL